MLRTFIAILNRLRSWRLLLSTGLTENGKQETPGTDPTMTLASM